MLWLSYYFPSKFSFFFEFKSTYFRKSIVATYWLCLFWQTWKPSIFFNKFFGNIFYLFLALYQNSKNTDSFWQPCLYNFVFFSCLIFYLVIFGIHFTKLRISFTNRIFLLDTAGYFLTIPASQNHKNLYLFKRVFVNTSAVLLWLS